MKISKTKIKRAIELCDMNIKKIEKFNEHVGTMFEVSPFGYLVAKKTLMNLLNEKDVIIPKIEFVSNVRFFAYDWVDEDDTITCDECGIEIPREDSIETSEGKTLCSGCDSKRLEKENSVYVD